MLNRGVTSTEVTRLQRDTDASSAYQKQGGKNKQKKEIWMPDKKFICLSATGTSVVLTLATLHQPVRAAVLSRTGSWVVEGISPAPGGFTNKAAASRPLR